MLKKIISKSNFIKKLPRRLAKNILSTIINIDELFWKFRIIVFILIFGRKNRIGKALSDLKKTGIAIIPKFYSDDKVLKIKEECIKQLDRLPIEKLGNSENIQDLLLENNLRVERVKGQIKLKGLHYINLFFKKIGRDFSTNLITLAYHFYLSKPFLIYNLVHDGSFNHKAVPGISGSELISGKLHVDLYVHELRCGIVLDDIKKENGPTLCYKNSMYLDQIKQNHLNLLLEQFNFEPESGGSHLVNEEKAKFLEEKVDKIYAVGNKGDLLLLDLKTVHSQTPLKEGAKTYTLVLLLVFQSRLLANYFSIRKTQKQMESPKTLRFYFRKIFKYLVFLSFFPLVFLMDKIKKYKFIKLAEIDASRIGNSSQIVEGYLIVKNIFDELKNCKIIFFFSFPIVNYQVTKMIKRVIPVNSFAIFFIFLKKALLFWKKNDHVLEFDKFSFQSLFTSSSHIKLTYNKPNLYFTKDEKRKGTELVKQLGIKVGDKWICIHNRDSLFLRKTFPHRDWSYHDYRDFSVNSLQSASKFFTSKGYFVIRIGSLQKEKFITKNPKIIDYANSNLRNDFLDIYLLANCEFYFGSDSGIMTIPFIFKKPCYCVNHSPRIQDELQQKLFIFKRIKSLDNGKLLSLKEVLNNESSFDYTAQTLKKNNRMLINNSSDEIKSFAVEINNEIKGLQIEDKEDIKMQKEFWKIYLSYVDKKDIRHVQTKISPSFLRNNLDLLK